MVEGEPTVFYAVDYLRQHYGNGTLSGPWPIEHSRTITQHMKLSNMDTFSTFLNTVPHYSPWDLCGKDFKESAEKDLNATYEKVEKPGISWQTFAINSPDPKINYKLYFKITSDDQYKCNKCDRKIKDKSNMFKHIRSHLQVKKFTCTVCAKSFNCSSNFKEHLNRHPQSRSTHYKCLECDKIFYSVGNMKSHCLTHKMAEMRRQNCLISDCPRYGLSFTNFLLHLKKAHNISSYDVYLKRVHQEIQRISREKVFDCGTHFSSGYYKYIPSIIGHSCDWCSCLLKFYNDGENLLKKMVQDM